MVVHHNGQQAAVTGWFVDGHGHRLFLRRGDLVPLCPHIGLMPVLWRLIQEIADRPGR